jgi:hypothetical protein
LALATIISAKNRFTNQPEGNQKKSGSRRDPIVWATIVIAFFAFISACIAGLQWCTLEKTNETMRAGERAFVFVKQGPTNWFDTKINGKDVSRSFVVEWENSGNSQTRDMVIQLFCVPLQPFTSSDPIKFSTLTGADTRLLGPKQTVWGGLCSYTDKTLAEAQAGNGHIYVGAKVSYYDIFDSRHTTEYCTEIFDIEGKVDDINVSPHFRLKNCGRNCADKECDRKQ